MNRVILHCVRSGHDNRCPENTGRSLIVISKLAHRLNRCSNIESGLVLVFGEAVSVNPGRCLLVDQWIKTNVCILQTQDTRVNTLITGGEF